MDCSEILLAFSFGDRNLAGQHTQYDPQLLPAEIAGGLCPLLLGLAFCCRA